MGRFGSSQLNFLILNYSAEDSSQLYTQKGYKSCETADHTGSILVPEQIPPQLCLAGHQITLTATTLEAPTLRVVWLWGGSQCSFTNTLWSQCCWNPAFLLLRMWDSNLIYWCESVHKWHYHYKWKWEKSEKFWLSLWEMNSCHAPASVKCSICTCVCVSTPICTHTPYILLSLPISEHTSSH